MLRRNFLLTSLAATVRNLRAAASGLKLGYDTYSIRAWGMKAMAHLDFAAAHGLTAIQISSLGDFESLEPAHLAKVKAKAAELGIAIDGGTGCVFVAAVDVEKACFGERHFARCVPSGLRRCAGLKEDVPGTIALAHKDLCGGGTGVFVAGRLQQLDTAAGQTLADECVGRVIPKAVQKGARVALAS